jgi:uncharacterized membrane protein
MAGPSRPAVEARRGRSTSQVKRRRVPGGAFQSRRECSAFDLASFRCHFAQSIMYLLFREGVKYPDQGGKTVRHFSFRPALTFRGRTFKGLRGWSGKPLHPPLTDIPVAAYVIAAAFDLISFIGDNTSWQREFYQAATFSLIAGALVSLPAIATGVWDRWRSSEAGTQARRTINAHAVMMVLTTVLVVVDLGLRWFRYHSLPGPTPALLGLSLAAALVVATGATYGGTLVFGYGFNVETAGDHPVWHRSERDVFPGQPNALPAESTGASGDTSETVA